MTLLFGLSSGVDLMRNFFAKKKDYLDSLFNMATAKSTQEKIDAEELQDTAGKETVLLQSKLTSKYVVEDKDEDVEELKAFAAKVKLEVKQVRSHVVASMRCEFTLNWNQVTSYDS